MPQDPKANTAARKEELDAKRKDYRWSTDVRGLMDLAVQMVAQEWRCDTTKPNDGTRTAYNVTNVLLSELCV